MFHFYLALIVFIVPVLGVTHFDHLSRDVPLSDQMRGVMLYLRHTNLTLHTCYEIANQLVLWAHENYHDCRDLNLVEDCQRSLNSTNERNEATKHKFELNLEACQSKGFLYTAVTIAVLIVAGVSLAIGYAIGSAKKKPEQT